MENMVYFAVFGGSAPALPQNTCAAYGGFGFEESGKPRIPYLPPRGAAILFDDRIVPAYADLDAARDLLAEYRTVFFDFEHPKNELLCRLLASVPCPSIVVPPQYAGLCHAFVLVRAYRPSLPFDAYLQAVRRQFRRPVLDLSPISFCLRNGLWQREPVSAQTGGRLSPKHRCMYRSQGTELHFFDTKESLLARANACGLPCLLPLSEFEALK